MLVKLLELVEIVSPCLHHLSALRQIFRIIICRSHFILLSVGKLPLNPVPVIAEFIEHRAMKNSRSSFKSHTRGK